MMLDEIDVPSEELEIIPEVVTEDWNPENYVVPSYDDPGSTLESDHDNG